MNTDSNKEIKYLVRKFGGRYSRYYTAGHGVPEYILHSDVPKENRDVFESEVTEFYDVDCFLYFDKKK